MYVVCLLGNYSLTACSEFQCTYIFHKIDRKCFFLDESTCELLSRTVTDLFLHSALLKLQELEMLNLNGMGINFHKLQVYSNTLEDVIQESPTFSYILRCIKVQGSLTIVTFMV